MPDTIDQHTRRFQVTKTPPQVHDPEGMTKHDVSCEAWRAYAFSDGFEYMIQEPKTLWVKRKDDGDSHRILDGKGVIHYVNAGWRALRWKNLPGRPEVSF
ncbi:hypothetical protein [Phyllobacterium myrsinacearum]|uniref:Uncharacterized protein n=1 Tax=Phyllobacterium myrsinacearum TaxID=28101 RepID=A0A839ESD1_9HYPH|nr:hypothetical protein [Phyllobacterium myrsinacearum]MBA8881712.1 hypothetical protein [Phyllobacterium myrsinacearum]